MAGAPQAPEGVPAGMSDSHREACSLPAVFAPSVVSVHLEFPGGARLAVLLSSPKYSMFSSYLLTHCAPVHVPGMGTKRWIDGKESSRPSGASILAGEGQHRWVHGAHMVTRALVTPVEREADRVTPGGVCSGAQARLAGLSLLGLPCVVSRQGTELRWWV